MAKLNRLPSFCTETEAAIKKFENEGGVVKVYKPYERTQTETEIEDTIRGNNNTDITKRIEVVEQA